jgi:hypothetical protein
MTQAIMISVYTILVDAMCKLEIRSRQLSH